MGADTGLYHKCLGELECRFRERDYLHSCIVRGPTSLHAADLTMPDIRAGASYLLAALCAEGTSRVWGIEHIERGYDQLYVKLNTLGAKITMWRTNCVSLQKRARWEKLYVALSATLLPQEHRLFASEREVRETIQPGKQRWHL